MTPRMTPTDVIHFRVPAIPIAQPRHRIAVVNGKGRAFGAKKSHPIHEFKATARMAFSELYDGPPLEGPISLVCVFVMPRVSAQIWKTKPMPRLLHAKKPDADNLLKGVKDALTGLAWVDDSQVAEVLVRKVIAAGDEQPHVTVQIRKMDENATEFLNSLFEL